MSEFPSSEGARRTVVCNLARFANLDTRLRRVAGRAVDWRNAVGAIGLLRLFGIVSFVSIMLVSLLVAFGASQLFAAKIVDRDALVTSQFVQSILESAPSDAAAFDGEFPPYQVFFGGYGDAALEMHFEGFFERLGYMPDVIRASAYAADGMRIWSTSPKQVGIQNVTTNRELHGATLGELSAEFTEQIWFPTEAESARLRPGVRQYLETYIPIWNRERDAVVGIVETYKMADELFSTVQSSQRLVFGGVVLGGLLLYAILYGVVRRAAAQIDRQRGQLLEAEHFAAIGQMASAVAHSIRNPLTAIRSTAEVLIEGHSDPRSSSELHSIIEDVDRTDGALRGLLQYAQLAEHEPVRTDIEKLLAETLRQMGSRAERQGVVMGLEAQASLPAVFGSPALLAQAAETIAVNALDAMPSGGEFTVAARASNGSKQVEVAFRDSGPGIEPEEVDKIFTPFYTTKGHGMGVGLSLARRIVDLHGGAISIAGAPGSGTTVTMALPVDTRS